MRFTPRFSITNAIAAALTEIERARGFLDAASLSDEWIDSMRSRAFLLEAHHTTHIEGTRLTIEEAADLLAGDDVPGADPDDTRELLNYRDAFEFVSTYLNDGGPITERLILDIHRHLVSGVSGGSAAPGQYRRVQNYVVNSATGETIYTPPPVRDVPILMRELVSWLNRPGDIHPVIASGIAQFQLVHIHPFLDGNGRTSRLFSTLCLYRAGLRLQAAVHHQRILRPGPRRHRAVDRKDRRPGEPPPAGLAGNSPVYGPGWEFPLVVAQGVAGKPGLFLPGRKPYFSYSSQG